MNGTIIRLKGTDNYYYVHTTDYDRAYESYMYMMYQLSFEGQYCYLMHTDLALTNKEFPVVADIVLFMPSIDTMMGFFQSFGIQIMLDRFINMQLNAEFMRMLQVKKQLIK